MNFSLYQRAKHLFVYPLVLALGASLFLEQNALAGPREQAKRIHDRLVGVPPTPAVLDAMAAKLAAGAGVDAALDAMQNPSFYNSTLKNFVTPWTNVERTVFSDLNDYTATVIGVVRDDVPFTDVLSEDILYVGGSGTTTATYSVANNDHYAELEAKRVDLSDPTKLVRSTQSTQTNSPVDASSAAGIITTRAFGAAFFSAGTNRRALRFVALNYLCRDMEQLSDITLPADRVRQDVSRSPGGDSALFLTNCVGCHNGMDALTGAFAFYDFDEKNGLIYARDGAQIKDRVQAKYLINNNTFPNGFITVDDSWINYWRIGTNASLGWRTSKQTANDGKGNGAKSLGAEIAASKAFSQCQVQKVFQQVCFRAPNSAQDHNEIDRITAVFETSNYSLKRVFAEVANSCKGP